MGMSPQTVGFYQQDLLHVPVARGLSYIPHRVESWRPQTITYVWIFTWLCLQSLLKSNEIYFWQVSSTHLYSIVPECRISSER